MCNANSLYIYIPLYINMKIYIYKYICKLYTCCYICLYVIYYIYKHQLRHRGPQVGVAFAPSALTLAWRWGMRCHMCICHMCIVFARICPRTPCFILAALATRSNLWSRWHRLWADTGFILSVEDFSEDK